MKYLKIFFDCLAPTMIVIIVVSAGVIGCGTLGGFSNAIQESGALQERSDELDEKMDLLEQTLEVYGPIAEEFGPEVKESYDQLVAEYAKVRTVAAEGRELLAEVKALHESSLKKSTDEEGNTDWIKYGLLMLAGGGAAVNERRKTGKEKEAMHKRIDSRKQGIKSLQWQLDDLKNKVEVEKALRAQPPV